MTIARRWARGHLAIALAMALLLPVGGWALDRASQGTGDVLRVVDAPDTYGALPARVVLQVIDSTFHKWYEYDVDGTGAFFIVQHEPTRRALSAQEAEALLEASAGWMHQVPMSEEGYVLSPDDPRLDLPVLTPQLSAPLGALSTGAQGEDQPYPPAKTDPFDWDEPGALRPAGYEPSRVHGTDDRVRVTSFASTTQYPFSTIGYVSIVKPDGGGFRGTGFLVAPYTILTNAHNIYDSDAGSYMRSFEFAPGQHQSGQGATPQRPYGSRQAVEIQVNNSFVAAGPGYTQAHIEHDYAAAFISTPFGNITTFMPLVFDHTPSYVNLAGYPKAVQNESNSLDMWFCSSAVVNVLPRVIEYTADTTGGNSGGPVWVYNAQTGLRRVVAVHCFGGPTRNGATRLSSFNRSLIEQWMRWTPGTQPPGNRPPTVSLSYTPANPTTADTMTFTATASDPDGDPLSYAWYLNGNLQQGVTAARVTWSNPSAGTHTMRVRVSDGRGGTAEASVTFTVRAPGTQPPGDQTSHTYGSASGWYLISVPMEVPPYSGITQWWWNPTARAYARPTTLRPQAGYWAQLPANATARVTGTPVTSDAVLSLGASGWHMISAPWNYPLAAVQVIRGGDARSWSQAVAAGWVRSVVYGYRATDRAYTTPSTLHPWYGYWLDARVSGLTLRFVYAARTSDEQLSNEPELVPAGQVPVDLPPLPGAVEAVAGFTVLNQPNPVTGDTTVFRATGLMGSSVEGIRVTVRDLGGRTVWQGSTAGAELSWHTDGIANGTYLYEVEVKVLGEWQNAGIHRLLILR